MRFLRLILLIGLATGYHNAFALENEFSAGVAAISPTGLTFKLWTSRNNAVDFFTAWSSHENKIQFHIDYLNHDFSAIEIEPGAMAFYYGFGIRMSAKKNSSTKGGFRIPLGVTYLMENIPLDFFGELAPRSNLFPNTNFATDVMVGIRYRLNPRK